MKNFLRLILHVCFLFCRPITLGVRGIVYDHKSRTVLMVKHTYSSGWYLPGGGVECGESYATALKRELMEEVGIEFEDSTILDVYYNSSISKRDHVVITTINFWKKRDDFKRPGMEIAETSWFRVTELPDQLSPCTESAMQAFLKHQNDIR